MSETVREVCAEAKSMNWVGYWNAHGKTVEDFIDRILAAHEREMKAVRQCLTGDCERFKLGAEPCTTCTVYAHEREMAAKDAEIARLKAAFIQYCEGMSAVTNDKCLLDTQCQLCHFAWLDLEAEEEKPETIEDVIVDMEKCVEMMRKKESEGATLLDVSVIFDKFLNRIVAAHNRVAKK